MRCLPALQYMKKLTESGVIGNTKFISAQIFNSLSKKEYPSLFDAEKGGGALYDVGCYCLHFVSFFFGLPQKADFEIICTNGGPDETSVVIAKYDNEKIAVAMQSIGAENNVSATISGDKGYIEVPMFLNGDEFTVKKNRGDSGTVYRFKCKDISLRGYGFEVLQFVYCIKKKESNIFLVPVEESGKIISVIEAAVNKK